MLRPKLNANEPFKKQRKNTGSRSKLEHEPNGFYSIANKFFDFHNDTGKKNTNPLQANNMT